MTFFLTTENPLSAEEWPVSVEALYVVAWGEQREFLGDDYPSKRRENVFTLSPFPNRCGWQTDSSCGGYGLPLAVALEIAERFNDVTAERLSVAHADALRTARVTGLEGL